MKLSATRVWLLLVLTSGLTARGQITETYNFSPNVVIPDGNPSGVSDTRTISGSAITQIGTIIVSLDISTTFNGDLYGYLRHSSGLSVLLNRVGRTATNPNGYDDSGFQVTLKDTAVNVDDIHNYQNTTTPGANLPLIGQWKPDGRDSDPALVLDTDGRLAKLDVFNGLNANGDWTLFLADMSGGAPSTLNSWGMQITAVPEPQQIALITGLALGGLVLWRKRNGLKTVWKKSP